MLNTKETRKMVWDMIAQKNSVVWNTWTNTVEKDCAVDNTVRNLCFGILGEKFTEAECKWLQFMTGCKKVHFTHNKQYLRLLGVKFEG